jgi:hypothetical protein
VTGDDKLRADRRRRMRLRSLFAVRSQIYQALIRPAVGWRWAQNRRPGRPYRDNRKRKRRVAKRLTQKVRAGRLS